MKKKTRPAPGPRSSVSRGSSPAAGSERPHPPAPAQKVSHPPIQKLPRGQPSGRKPAAGPGGARERKANPAQAAFAQVAHELLEEISTGTERKRKELLHHVFHKAEMLWDEKVFSKGSYRGRKAVLKATLEMIDASIRCCRTARKKVGPKKVG